MTIGELAESLARGIVPWLLSMKRRGSEIACNGELSGSSVSYAATVSPNESATGQPLRSFRLNQLYSQNSKSTKSQLLFFHNAAHGLDL